MDIISILLLNIGIVTTLPGSTYQKECHSSSYRGINYSWCIERPAKGQNPDVLYYMHGAGQNATIWAAGARRKTLRDEWVKMNYTPPTVITVSFGPFWHLLDIPVPDYKLPLRDVFVNHVMPQIEQGIGGVKGRRLLFGESMGGFNAATLLLKNGNLFSKVVLGCPAFLPLGPFSTQKEIADFYQRHQPYVDPPTVQELLDWDIEEYKTQRQWKQHDPLELVKNISKTSPPVHVSCGDKDEYAFQEGAKLFYDIAIARGVQAKWELIPDGKHCAINGPDIAHFLAE